MSSVILKIIFAGTPNFAARHLCELLKSKHKVVAVFTQPDRMSGRGNKLTASPVKIMALTHNIPVFQPETLKLEYVYQLFSKIKADIMIVVAYGLMIPQKILDIPILGCINIHASLLPRWRGAAPIQRAICAGDIETGITITKMNIGLDTGDILNKLTCVISAEDTTETLYHKLAELGSRCMLLTLEQLINGDINLQVQQESLVTYAKKLNKQEARLNWLLSATQLQRYIRAFNPWPISYFIANGELIKVWKATILLNEHGKFPGEIIQADKNGIQIATASGILNITQLQPANKKIMSSQDFLNSRREWFTIGNVIT